MKIYRIKHHGLDVVRVFRNGIMLFGRGLRILLGAGSLSMDSAGDLTAGAAAGMESAPEIGVDITAETLTCSAAAPAYGRDDLEITADAYASLYARLVGECASLTVLSLDLETEANAPESAAGMACAKGEFETAAAANAPSSAVVGAEPWAAFSAEAEAAAPQAAPMEVCFVWDFPLTADAELTPVGAAGMAAESTASVDGEAEASKEITRFYTVRFYDGENLLSEQQVAHGETAVPPDTTKEGYSFFGWEPSSLVITEDTDFYGIWDIGTTIVPRQTFTFANNNMFGGPYGAVYPDKTEWDLGKLGGICVEWDGVQYGPLQAQSIAAKENGTTAYCVGNRSIVTKFLGYTVTVTYPDTGEPFAVSWFLSDWRIATNSTDETHTVRIYTK